MLSDTPTFLSIHSTKRTKIGVTDYGEELQFIFNISMVLGALPEKNRINKETMNLRTIHYN
jgi:hypothetical protein